MAGLDIDIALRSYYFEMCLVYIRMFLKAVKGGTFKLANPKQEHRTERQSCRLSQS